MLVEKSADTRPGPGRRGRHGIAGQALYGAARMTNGQHLIEAMHAHLAEVRAATHDNEFVDIEEAVRLHALLVDALGEWDSLSDEQRAVLANAVSYLVRTDDDEDDLGSPIGFEDDAEVVESALRRIRQPGKE